jgi:sulfur carrier protein ThiS
MNVNVEVHGTIRSYLPASADLLQMEVPTGASVGDVIRRLGIPIERGWNASIESRLVSDKDVLHEGDHLMVFDVIGGG